MKNEVCLVGNVDVKFSMNAMTKQRVSHNFPNSIHLVWQMGTNSTWISLRVRQVHEKETNRKENEQTVGEKGGAHLKVGDAKQIVEIIVKTSEHSPNQFTCQLATSGYAIWMKFFEKSSFSTFKRKQKADEGWETAMMTMTKMTNVDKR